MGQGEQAVPAGAGVAMQKAWSILLAAVLFWCLVMPFSLAALFIIHDQEIKALQAEVAAFRSLVTPGEGEGEGDERGDAQDLRADALAGMICAECKSCSREERIAVAFTAVNRALRPDRWPGGLVQVLRADKQFAVESTLCQPNLPGEWSAGWRRRHTTILAEIRTTAEEVLSGRVKDPVGATHFHAKWIDGVLWPELMDELPAPENWQHKFFRESGSLVTRR